METYEKITEDGEEFIEVTTTESTSYKVSVADLEKRKLKVDAMLSVK